MRNDPSPVQQHLPILIGGTGRKVTLKLTAQYAVDAETASRDVEDLVGGLHSAGLVEE